MGDADPGHSGNPVCEPAGHGVGVCGVAPPQAVGQQRHELCGHEAHLGGQLHGLLADVAQGRPVRRHEGDDRLGAHGTVLRRSEGQHVYTCRGAFGSAAGVDVLSFGATKNGAMGAEAVVSFVPADGSPLRYIRKQSMQLASKMRFVSAQFVALLSDGLWRSNAAHANTMARRLADGVAGVPGVSVAHPVESNAVFAVLPPAVTEALQRHHPFYVWEEGTGMVRWMASFDTTEQDVDALVELVAAEMSG